MMLGDLVNAGSTFEDEPLTASDFDFSNPLFTVDPATGLPPVPAPVAVPSSASAASTGGNLGGGTLLFVAAAAVAVYFYWPQIRAEVSKYVG